MKSSKPTDWPGIREKASRFSEEAFAFVRDGLTHTVKSVHGEAVRRMSEDPIRGEGGLDEEGGAGASSDERFHVTGQQLCLGLRGLALERYGLLAKTVLNKWGVRRTDDFGTIVYAMIDRGDLRSSERDSLEDFAGVYDFDEAFDQVCLR